MLAYISLGSNLGNRRLYIKKAIKMLGRGVKKISPVIETEPLGMEKSNKFLNAVVEYETELQPLKLLNFLEDIEKKLGRTDKGKYRSRTIDLDILFYDSIKINTKRLTIPHPKIKEREFLCTLLTTLKKEKAEKK
jgi:2-amino-4-hydroxy-6-hydroxymethyldihydropteridine diphosphokinase